MDMQEMQPPPRPAELDMLDCFVGTWEGKFEVKIPGTEEPITGTGKSVTKWSFDNMFLVEEGTYDMGEMGTMTGMGIWGWNPKSKKYCSWWFNNWGEASSGTAEYEAEEKTWELESQGVSPMSGKMSYGECEVRMVDEDTQAWHCKEWDNAMHWGTPIEMTGSAKRVK
jgi:hypothetical protein